MIYSGVLTHRNGQYAHTPAEHNQRLRPDVKTVFEKLKSRGYRTALIGKTHIAPLEKYPVDSNLGGQTRKVGALAEAAGAS